MTNTNQSCEYTKRSTLTGKVHTIELPISAVEFQIKKREWWGGVKIQDAFPTLTADQREFIMTGITAEEWEKM